MLEEADDSKNPLFESVSYGAEQLQKMLVIQWFYRCEYAVMVYYDNHEGGGGRLKAERELYSRVRVLYSILRPRIKSKQSEKYVYDLARLDALRDNRRSEELLNELIEYCELDLKLTKIDTKQEYNTVSAWRKQGVKLP